MKRNRNKYHREWQRNFKESHGMSYTTFMKYQKIAEQYNEGFDAALRLFAKAKDMDEVTALLKALKTDKEAE